VARYLGDRKGRLERLAKTVEEALGGGLDSTAAETIGGSEPVEVARGRLGDHPLLVLSRGRVVGILTAFDLL
jgi:hypothetical protein